VVALFTGRGALPTEKGFVDQCGGEDEVVGVVLDSSSFYAQQGGQVWDTGLLTATSGSAFSVTNVQLYAGYVVHIGEVSDGSIAVGDQVTCVVDYARRKLVVPNHTCTHVLNYALRKVLLNGGDPEAEREGKLNQKGSDVNADRLRFDCAWDEPLTAEQIVAVEAIVNQQVADNYVVYDKVTPLEEAKAIFGLRAVFGEAYPDPVRVVSVGADVDKVLANPSDPQWGSYSIEFCGGTHLASLGDAELLVITEETSTAAGVRRITAVTRQRAKDAVEAGAQLGEGLKALEGLEVGAALVKGVKAFKKALPLCGAGQAARYAALDRLALLEKAGSEFTKAQGKELEAKATAAAKDLAAGFDKAAKGFSAILSLGFAIDGKVNSGVMKLLAKACPGGSFLVVASDEANDQVLVFGAAAKGDSSVDALAWCAASLAPLGTGSKTGGKSMSAMGSGPGFGKVAVVLAAAEAFKAAL
jgi:alanyl-tRNA synthetase